MSLKSKVAAFVLIGAFLLASTQLLAEGKSKTPQLSANAKKAKLMTEYADMMMQIALSGLENKEKKK